MAETKQSAAEKTPAAEEKPTGWVPGAAEEAEPAAKGYFSATKRLAGTDTLVELSASSQEALDEKIKAWEAAQPSEGPPAPLSEEMLLGSARATAAQAVTAGARVSYDVNLTPPAEKAEAKATNVSTSPTVEETELEKPEAEALAGQATSPQP